MARPTQVTVAGQFLKVDGTPDKGTLTFHSRVYSLYSTDSVAMVPSAYAVTLDDTGSFEIQVPATNDPAWSPVGWTYALVMKLSNDYSVFDVSIPYDAGTLSLAELIPVTPSSGIMPGNYAPLVHTHDAAAIVSGVIAAARLPIGTTSGTVAAGDHTHSGGGSGGPIAISDVTGLQSALDGKSATSHTHSISNVTGLQTALDSKANSSSLAAVALSGSYTDLSNKPSIPVTSVSGRVGDVVLTKSDVGLANVDNTSDANKPVSTATQTALNLKANTASPTFTGTVSGITKSMVGLSNVDNTSDANKPVSTATQAALDLKAGVTALALVSDRVTNVEDMTPVILVWNGTSYVESSTARVYVGPSDPGVVPDGSVWIDTDA